MATDVISKVRSALGRTASLTTPPVPPVIDEPVTRLVHTDIGLPELFAKSAAEMKMLVELVHVDDLLDKLIAYLKECGCQSVALPKSALLEKLRIPESLLAAGFDSKTWDVQTLDEIYDVDAGVTDVTYAVAETGSLVMRASAGHGRGLSLVPPIHVAIVEPKNLVPDLVDLFEGLAKDGTGSATTLITGPSKTSDIEMNLVVGVHGPVVVKVFVLH